MVGSTKSINFIGVSFPVVDDLIAVSVVQALRLCGLTELLPKRGGVRSEGYAANLMILSILVRASGCFVDDSGMQPLLTIEDLDVFEHGRFRFLSDYESSNDERARP